ncbi:hypothetical protein NBC2815_01102 [Xanthomonas fragariae]|nr:hypothetical protein NBC2815_01102 [Xanthomonas fragariae]
MLTRPSKDQQSEVFVHVRSLLMPRMQHFARLRYSCRSHSSLLQSRQTQQVMTGNLQPDYHRCTCQAERA